MVKENHNTTINTRMLPNVKPNSPRERCVDRKSPTHSITTSNKFRLHAKASTHNTIVTTRRIRSSPERNRSKPITAEILE